MPRVFISYSWDSDEHKDRVRSLATFFRRNGIDARLARFTPPSGWTTQVQGGGGIVAASFTGAGGARITATRLANDGGGDLANINRWRGQLGLAPLALASAWSLPALPFPVDPLRDLHALGAGRAALGFGVLAVALLHALRMAGVSDAVSAEVDF
jgi:hypothetical protein